MYIVQRVYLNPSPKIEPGPSALSGRLVIPYLSACMNEESGKIRDLFAEARRYEQLGDHYNAIKLYKLLVREAPTWTAPYQRLGQVYKYRGEWKPAFHYTKKALALDSAQPDAWWDLGIAAAAMDKEGLARGIWNKFGIATDNSWVPQPLSIRLNLQPQFELVWALTCDPARARIQSIPAPGSNHRYGDIILYDREVIGHQVVSRRRIGVHPELGLYKRSLYQTYSCKLQVYEAGDVQLLDELARKAGLGFELWSNARKVFTNPKRQPEYFSPLPEAADLSGGDVEVALAALRKADVLEVLRNWEIICLGRFEELTLHA